jgi:CRISPR-associated protein Cas5d
MVYPPLEVKVWGDLACYTRPEHKVERVSYEVITPSAARGVLEAIFWKPEMHWEVREIRVLTPIKYFSFTRNELKGETRGARMSERTIEQWEREGGHYYINDDRTQRHTLALRDVAYVIVADVVVEPGVSADPAKYRDQFRDRVAKGQCFRRPYLGLREFAAFFDTVGPQDRPIPYDKKLGPMLFDLLYEPGKSGRGTPLWFAAKLVQGVLVVPSVLYQDTRGNRGKEDVLNSSR